MLSLMNTERRDNWHWKLDNKDVLQKACTFHLEVSCFW